MADCPPAVEHEAQRIAAQLVARGAPGDATAAGPADVQRVGCRLATPGPPRSVGVEQVGLWALEQLGLPALLADLGVNGALRAAAAGALVGRLAQPASERATHRWLQARSGLGELLGVDFETVSAMQLYRASDALVKHREAVEAHLFDRALGLFDLQPTVTLYDLTNTYFEGEASEQPQAQRGHSKEKRSDCPLLTLGLMLDASGFVRRSQLFAGNVREHRTLAGMLEALRAPAGALVVMDRGVATDACITWLREHGYRYLGRQPGNATGNSMPMPPCRSARSRTRPCICTRSSPPTPTRCACTATPRSEHRRNEASSSASPPASRPRSPSSTTGWRALAPTSASPRSGSASDA